MRVSILTFWIIPQRLLLIKLCIRTHLDGNQSNGLLLTEIDSQLQVEANFLRNETAICL